MSIATEAVTAFLSTRAEHNGHLGSIEVLPIESLRIDPTYQRDLVQNLVDEIALAYDPLTAGVVLVSRRDDGELYIVDGQHKTAGAQQAGRSTVLCLVVNGLTSEDEARLRLAANVKRADSIGEKWKARIAAGEKTPIAVTNLVESFGTQINISPIAHTGINAIGALETIYNLDRTGEMLTRVLTLIQNVWGTPEGEYAYATLLKGLAYFYDKHDGEFDEARFVERLGIEGPTAIRRMAQNHKVVLGGSMWLNVYRSVVEVYNLRLGDSSKLEWKTGGWSKRMTSGEWGN